MRAVLQRVMLVILATVHYLPPENIHSSDIFKLVLIMYQANLTQCIWLMQEGQRGGLIMFSVLFLMPSLSQYVLTTLLFLPFLPGGLLEEELMVSGCFKILQYLCKCFPRLMGPVCILAN